MGIPRPAQKMAGLAVDAALGELHSGQIPCDQRIIQGFATFLVPRTRDITHSMDRQQSIYLLKITLHQTTSGDFKTQDREQIVIT